MIDDLARPAGKLELAEGEMAAGRTLFCAPIWQNL